MHAGREEGGARGRGYEGGRRGKAGSRSFDLALGRGEEKGENVSPLYY